MNPKNNFEDIIFDKTIMESTLVAFSETWLHSGIANTDIRLSSFQSPERKDKNVIISVV